MIAKELNILLINVNIPNKQKAFLIQRLSEVEYRLSINCDEKI